MPITTMPIASAGCPCIAENPIRTPTAIVIAYQYFLNFFRSIIHSLRKVYITFCYINFTICKLKFTYLPLQHRKTIN